MSVPSGSGGSEGGVVRSSALSFIAQAQGGETRSQAQGEMPQGEQQVPEVPLGLKALCECYSRLYPDQPNPLQVTTRLKYWLGGQDPLDYISMYWNPGKPDEHITPHWHYVTFGLSDLHGDGRVHPPPDPVVLPSPSGCGLELTLRAGADRQTAPLWPAALLQALARYILLTGNKFVSGDHISWHAPLDGSASRVRHLLVTEDPQLQPISTPYGTVSFLQMVGCTSRELRAAQRGSGFEVLKLMSEDTECGGKWLVTRTRRKASAKRVRKRRESGPAQLAGVSCGVRWQSVVVPASERAASPCSISPDVEQQIKDTLQRGLSTMSTDRTGPEGHTGMSTDSFEMSSIERALPHIPNLVQGSWRGESSIQYLDGVHLYLNAEGASLLPLAIDGRVSHGRHFTWRCGGRAVTMLSPLVSGSMGDALHPYAVRDSWLQMIIPKDLASEMSSQLSCLARLADTDSETDSEDERDRAIPSVPLTLSWPKHRLTISVVHHDLL